MSVKKRNNTQTNSKDAKQITKLLPASMVLAKECIFYQHNSYIVGDLISASRQLLFIKSSETSATLRIKLENIFVIANLQFDNVLLSKKITCKGYLAYNQQKKQYQRAFKVNPNTYTVQFDRNELALTLQKQIKYKNRTYPSIVPMISIIQIPDIIKVLRAIPKNEIHFYKTVEEEDKQSNLENENENNQRRGKKRKSKHSLTIPSNKRHKPDTPRQRTITSLMSNLSTNVIKNQSENPAIMEAKENITDEKLDAIAEESEDIDILNSNNNINTLPLTPIRKIRKPLRRKTPKVSATEIKNNGKEIYKFEGVYSVVQYKNKRYVDIDGEYKILNTNSYLYSATRMDLLPIEMKKEGQGKDLKINCDGCLKWKEILEKQNKRMKFKSERERLIVEGLNVIENLTYCRSDYIKSHLKGPHISNKEKMDNYLNGPIIKMMKCIKSKLDNGELSDELAKYIPIFMVVYFAVNHHWSIASITEMKKDLLQQIIDFFAEKVINKSSVKTKSVFDKLKKSINTMDDIDAEQKEKLLKEIDTASDELFDYISGLNIHKLPSKYNNDAGIKKMIQCIADEIRIDVWGDLAKSPIAAILTDESIAAIADDSFCNEIWTNIQLEGINFVL